MHDVQSNFLTDYDAYRGGDKNYYFDDGHIEAETFDEDEYIGAINLQKPFKFGGTAGFAEAGLKYKYKDRFQQKSDSQLELIDADDLSDPDDFKNWFTTIDDPFLTEWDPPLDMLFISDNSTSMDENYTSNEAIMSAYIMGEFWFGKSFMVLPGVRYEGWPGNRNPDYLRRIIKTILMKRQFKEKRFR